MTMRRHNEREGKGLVQPGKLAAELERAKSILELSSVASRSAVNRIDTLRNRLVDRRLQLAVLGQFKRGKSTFINALLGVPILPVAVLPLTAVAIFISWGPDPVARVQFKGGRSPEEFHSAEPRALQEFLSRFVAEEQNPKNHLGVERVELSYPASILSNGTVLIDTPGVGSSHQHNTEAALQILPECDAAIFIVSADPPITEVELSYLQKIKPKAARIFFVLNKIDYLKPEEHNVALDFLARVLAEHSLLESSSPIFGVSARDALAAKQCGDREKITGSGIARIEDYLLHDLAAQKDRMLEHAVRRKATDILSQVIAESELRIKAVTLPIEQLTSKASEFEKALAAIEEQRCTLGDLLDGDRRRLIELLENRICELRGEAASKLTVAASQGFSGDTPSAWEQRARDSISTTIENIFEAARERFRKEFTEETARILAMHQSRLDGLVDSVRQTAAKIFDLPFSPQHEQDSFELGEDPYWVTEGVSATLLPDTGRIIDHLVSSRRRRSRLLSRIMRQTNDLIIRNAENLRWAILTGIANTMLRAADQFEERLRNAIATTKGVIDDALTRRNSQSLETEAEISARGHLVSDLSSIWQAILTDTPA